MRVIDAAQPPPLGPPWGGKELLLGSLAATRALGRKLGAALLPFDFVALTGDLGAGKTVLVKAMAEGAGAAKTSSPTFALVNNYQGRIPRQRLALYRLTGPAALFGRRFRARL